MKIILASQSPRRKQILSEIGYEFDIIVPNVNEDLIDGVSPAEFVKILSKRKSEAVTEMLSGENDTFTIIAADTVVVINDKILGKPLDEADAFNMLKTLSGNWHSVFTGLTVMYIENKNTDFLTEVCETRVKFRNLTDQEILAYIKTGESFDKAGSYGIQGFGKDFVETYDGSFTNVVGLPKELLTKLIQQG